MRWVASHVAHLHYVHVTDRKWLLCLQAGHVVLANSRLCAQYKPFVFNSLGLTLRVYHDLYICDLCILVYCMSLYLCELDLRHGSRAYNARCCNLESFGNIKQDLGRFWCQNSLADSGREAFASMWVATGLPHVCPTSHLDTCHHLPDANILQILDGCVNRCRATLDLILCSQLFFSTYHVIFSSNLANDSFNPAPASSLSFFLFTHSFTVYCIHVLFFYPHFFYRIPLRFFWLANFSLKGNCTRCCIGLAVTRRFNHRKQTRLCHSEAKKKNIIVNFLM